MTAAFEPIGAVYTDPAVERAGDLPCVALSVRQPWADLVINGICDTLNVPFGTNLRGPFLIHAALTVDEEAMSMVLRGHPPVPGVPVLKAFGYQIPKAFDRGGFVGIATIADCLQNPVDPSPWFRGPFGLALGLGLPIPFSATEKEPPAGFFHVDLMQRRRA